MARTSEPIYYTARMAPSVKTLQERLSVDHATARRLKAVLSGKVDLMTVESARRRQYEAYHDHEPVTLALEACNEILGTFGVEYIRSNEDTHREAAGIDYCNAGDTYRPTLTYDNRDDIWRACAWGDLVEADDRRFREEY